MPRAVAINVGANTNAPGVRGPVFPDGSFEFVPIPEEAPTGDPVPTYADLPLDTDLPAGRADAPVHLDPEFAEYPECERYTYGDPHGVKARPLLDLQEGDYALFYATLTTRGTPEREWIPPEWGAYLVGQFRLARDPVAGDEYPDLPADERERFRNNAHVKREEFDAAVLLAGDPAESGLYDTAVPLSSPERGSEANRVVTDLSSDSGKGPWWRRPMRFDESATAELLELVGDIRT
ncbi:MULTISPECIES: hypothetical protein [Halorussus]|uniref:Nmad3 family putative nucleotide modification protein n=1 Tax=Halorussus TaxID=1070314 RepID=UPI000E214E82|nr:MULTISPECIES: hypothetical protein [Halorussus]NHN60233.1 hypothetical protein [Halorussus sp. JP-T4]